MSTETDHATVAARLVGREHARFWWHSHPERRFEPDIYSVLTEGERSLLVAWYDETERDGHVGEMAVPMASLVLGLLNGSGARRVVQLGHYVGYSTLLIGWMLRRMGAERGLFSVDLRPRFTAFTQGWVDRAGLEAFVGLHTSDSADPSCVDAARAFLGGAPSCVIVDSSHQYAHTLAELDLWFDVLEPGGLMLLHDAGAPAAAYDRSGEGGVPRALAEWLSRPGSPPAITLSGPAAYGECAPYADPSGVCVIQKPR